MLLFSAVTVTAFFPIFIVFDQQSTVLWLLSHDTCTYTVVVLAFVAFGFVVVQLPFVLVLYLIVHHAHPVTPIV